MKNLFVCILLFTSFSSYGQYAPTEKVDAIDLKLDKFRKRHNTGTIIQIVGGLVTALGYYTQQNDGVAWKNMYLLGGACIVGGTITQMTSYSFLRPTQSPVKPD